MKARVILVPRMYHDGAAAGLVLRVASWLPICCHRGDRGDEDYREDPDWAKAPIHYLESAERVFPTMTCAPP
jgi:hypothetical protein